MDINDRRSWLKPHQQAERGCDGIGNIVQLEIEKYRDAVTCDGLVSPRSPAIEQLHADFDKSDALPKSTHKFDRPGRIGRVECEADRIEGTRHAPGLAQLSGIRKSATAGIVMMPDRSRVILTKWLPQGLDDIAIGCGAGDRVGGDHLHGRAAGK